MLNCSCLKGPHTYVLYTNIKEYMWETMAVKMNCMGDISGGGGGGDDGGAKVMNIL